MKIALIGHGAMGQLVESQASAAGDQIGAILTSRDSASGGIDDMAASLKGHDVAIDFSLVTPWREMWRPVFVPAFRSSKERRAGSRTRPRCDSIVTEHDGALVYGANFSIGVNVFYKIVAHAAKLMSQVDQYEVFLEEQHHSRKRDVPSGTALKLKEVMAEHIKVDIPIASTRAGDIPGTHRVGFDSAADQITLTHTARSRAGFAGGALMAARWIVGRKGVYEFSDVIDEILK